MIKDLDNMSIMELAIKNTDPNLGDGYKKNPYAHSKRKEEVDSMIKYCEICNTCWSNPPYSVDAAGFRRYPKGNVPTIGKKRKTCKICKQRGKI